MEILDYRLTDPEPPGAVAARLRARASRRSAGAASTSIAELDDGAALLVHLRMTGNLLWLPEPPASRSALPARPSSARRRRRLAYTDARRFGTWRVAEDGAEAWLAGKLGPEPLGSWAAADLAARAAGRKAPVKAALLDQRVVAGRREHLRGRGALRGQDPPGGACRAALAGARRAPARSVVAALERGIEAQGASIRDFRTPDGGYGSAQERFLAYGRGGEPCVRLRDDAEAHRRSRSGARSYCPRCQRF